MRKILNSFLSVNQKIILKRNTTKRFLHDYNFDSDEEILENYLGDLMLIGINLPDTKNVLTETSIDKLCESINKFHTNDEISVAVLHGCGGNFCSGAVSSQKVSEKCLKLINMLHKGKKPIIGSLSGYTKNFGFQLAVMCDLKAMEETSLAGFGNKNERSEIPAVVHERLVLSVGLSKAMEMVFTNCSWKAKEAQEIGFINQIVPCGAGLGKAVTWAQSIALSSLKTIIDDKSIFNSLFKSKN